MNKTQSSPSFKSNSKSESGGAGYSESSFESNESMHQPNNFNEFCEDFTSNSSKNNFECVEMKKENYDKLVTNLPVAHRTILLIVNNENKRYLIDKFTQICYRYSNK